MRSQNYHHLLIVDDEEDDRYIIDLSFRQIQWGEHIKLLGSGDDMFRHLDALSNPSTYPSLILLDYNMPKMGAEEIIGRLKRHEQYNSIKVAVYSTAMTATLITCVTDAAYNETGLLETCIRALQHATQPERFVF